MAGSWEVEGRDPEGCIGVVTGNGKGKTTYCLGRAMFFAANGIPSSILQFIKSPLAYGEVIACERFPNLEIKSMGEGFIFGPGSPSKKHREAARGAWEECLREIFSLTYRLIVLDEINVATQFDLVHPDRVREMMFLKPRNLHIVLSGRGAHPANSVTVTSRNSLPQRGRGGLANLDEAAWGVGMVGGLRTHAARSGPRGMPRWPGRAWGSMCR